MCYPLSTVLLVPLPSPPQPPTMKHSGIARVVNFLHCLLESTTDTKNLFNSTLTILHSERPKLHTILAFLSAIGLKVLTCSWGVQKSLPSYCQHFLRKISWPSGNILRCMGTPPSFSAMFSKGDNFCDFWFAYLEDEVFPKKGVYS